MRISRRSVLLPSVAAALMLGAAAAAEDWAGEEAHRIVDAAKARGGAIPEQAKALVDLAWPDNPQGDPRVRALARREIVGFGDHGLAALQARLVAAPPRYAADITSAIMETRLVVSAGLPPQYLPSLYDAVWFGPPEAKRLAMAELARYHYLPALLPIIDAAHEYPRLTSSVIESLGQLGDERARYYLGEIVMSARPPHHVAAAQALARIGGRAIETLRDATASPRAEIRGAAIDALIPVSRVEDLTILYEYVAQFPDDDARRVELVIQRARQLESLVEGRQYEESGEPE